MIRSKADYRFYIEADRLALGQKRKKPKFLGDDTWKFQLTLRKLEYYTNCRTDLVGRIIKAFVEYRCYKLKIKCGYTIACNTFGPGLAIVHRGTIVVNSKARVGAWCRMHSSVNIGAVGGDSDNVPTLGDRVYIGPGAKIFGKINISDGVAIGANAVVNKSINEPNVTVAGIPARIINLNGSRDIIKVFDLKMP